MLIPKVDFSPLSKEGNWNIVEWAWHQTGGPLPLHDGTVKLFPQLSESPEGGKKYSDARLDEDREKILEACTRFQTAWDKVGDEYMRRLSEVLQIEWPEDCARISGRVGVLPVCPRYIQERAFDISWWYSTEQCMTVTAHESCHYLYFEKWKTLVPSWEWDDFENPSLIWQLSEMAIDPILGRKQIGELFTRPFPAYDSFYRVSLGGKPLMETLREHFSGPDMGKNIMSAYEWLSANREELMSHF